MSVRDTDIFLFIIMSFTPSKRPTEVVLSGREAVVSKVLQVCTPALYGALL
jgi:hypothetical protein